MACNIDHSKEDVLHKLEQQREYLPEKIHEDLLSFLAEPLTQLELNEVFHLLKKYDLVSDEERAERNRKLVNLIDA